MMMNAVFWDVARCISCVLQSAATWSRWFPARGFFYPEDGGDTLLRNVGSHKIYTVPHPRRRHSLYSSLWKPQILHHDEDGNPNNVINSILSRIYTAKARIRSQVRSHGIDSRQTGSVVCFLWVLRFPLPIILPLIAPYSVSPSHRRYTVSIPTASLNNHPKKITLSFHGDPILKRTKGGRFTLKWMMFKNRDVIDGIGWDKNWGFYVDNIEPTDPNAREWITFDTPSTTLCTRIHSKKGTLMI
jgi:hypothetical protein